MQILGHKRKAMQNCRLKESCIKEVSLKLASSNSMTNIIKTMLLHSTLYKSPCKDLLALSVTCPISEGELQINLWGYIGILVPPESLKVTYSTTLNPRP